MVTLINFAFAYGWLWPFGLVVLGFIYFYYPDSFGATETGGCLFGLCILLIFIFALMTILIMMHSISNYIGY
jgi:hypothetical protein